MEEYKSNSLKVRDGAESKVEEKQIEPVISGSAKVHKQSCFGKFKDDIVAESFKNVGEWLWGEVVIPNTKRFIDDLVTNGIHMFLYGKGGGPKSSSIQKISYSNGSSFVNYSTTSKNIVKAGSHSSGINYDNIVFDSRGDAEAVLTQMEEMIDVYGMVSIADLYEMAELPIPSYTLNNYGWTDLKSATTMACRDGFLIRLPKATNIK